MSMSEYGLVTEGGEQQVAFYLCEQFAMLPFITALSSPSGSPIGAPTDPCINGISYPQTVNP